ncbi:hypothetical protein WMF20_07275 [Sorangium sp. So ce834]|uniref:hypothetical protein n=1 Tax=Sorangium sp. So ce834 TaxID=3133321 RepID=UPI003F641FA3
MKAKRLLGAALAVGLGLAAITSTTVVAAQPKGKSGAPAAAPARPAEPPATKKTIALTPAGISWGMSTKQVAAVIDKMLDEAYVPRYKATSPGVKMRALDAELAEEKSAFRRSRIDFGKLPTGIDATPLKGEYTYLNKESMMTLSRADGGKRYFFFIQDKLWKIIDEHALGEGNARGKDYQSAVIKLATTFGVPGRVTPPEPEKGRYVTEVDWKDAATHFRAIERSDSEIAFAYEDLVTLSSLDSLRPNKPVDANAIDPAVASAVRKDEPPPAPPPTDKSGKKK